MRPPQDLSKAVSRMTKVASVLNTFHGTSCKRQGPKADYSGLESRTDTPKSDEITKLNEPTKSIKFTFDRNIFLTNKSIGTQNKPSVFTREDMAVLLPGIIRFLA